MTKFISELNIAAHNRTKIIDLQQIIDTAVKNNGSLDYPLDAIGGWADDWSDEVNDASNILERQLGRLTEFNDAMKRKLDANTTEVNKEIEKANNDDWILDDAGISRQPYPPKLLDEQSDIICVSRKELAAWIRVANNVE